MKNQERMKLVVDGNAVYEVDEVCMQQGLNQEKEKNMKNKKEQWEGNKTDRFGFIP